jgi:hypothetical protein
MFCSIILTECVIKKCVVKMGDRFGSGLCTVMVLGVCGVVPLCLLITVLEC